ncbi:hypothetical protein K6U06_06610 [Acidiferrimicrobium sp. IK]|uniref:phage tail tube protein n=1 Tax=Acidiferrimicrobium sp. IK TaxID=2871700 RepID=UPI0021CB003D|nr:phage tail tube protein [Acidiferrimicrobium sp. IK]MCU4184025.1 hypothetical protein [Acidiferrimicrobium sp. IK]
MTASLIQRRLSKAGLAKQTAKGTAATAASYGYGIGSGSLFKLALTENEIPLTWSNRDILGFDRAGVKPSQSTETVATPDLLGLLLLGVLGADAVTGSAAPYTHTITPAAVLPYMTAFGSFGTADWVTVADSKVSSVELSWEEAGRVTVKADIMGCTPAFLAAAYTETTNEVISEVGFFTAGGGVFQVGGTPVQCSGGSIKFDTHIDQPITAANVLPTDVVEGKLEVTWSLKLLPTDTSIFREVYFGSGAAGALSGIASFPDLAALSAQFVGPTSTSLTISSPKARIEVEFPESNPDGGPAEITVKGTSTLPATGASVTAALLNSVPSY